MEKWFTQRSSLPIGFGSKTLNPDMAYEAFTLRENGSWWFISSAGQYGSVIG